MVDPTTEFLELLHLLYQSLQTGRIIIKNELCLSCFLVHCRPVFYSDMTLSSLIAKVSFTVFCVPHAARLIEFRFFLRRPPQKHRDPPSPLFRETHFMMDSDMSWTRLHHTPGTECVFNGAEDKYRAKMDVYLELECKG